MNRLDRARNLRRIIEGHEPEIPYLHGTGHNTKPELHGDGEVWTDSEGKMWEKTSWGKKSITKLEDARVPLFCPKCKGIMKRDLDTKMFHWYGQCFNCQIKFETELRATGKYKDWEREKLLNNFTSYMKELRSEVANFVNDLKNPTAIVHENGSLEVWTGGLSIEETETKLYNELNAYEVRVIESINGGSEETTTSKEAGSISGDYSNT